MSGTAYKNEKQNSSAVPWNVFKGSLIGVLSAVILALIFTAVALMTKDPDKFAGIFAYGALFIGAFISGVMTPKDGINPIVACLLSGGGYSLILWLTSLSFRKDGTSELSPIISLLLYLGCVVVSVAAGFIFNTRRKSLPRGKKSPVAMLRKQCGR